MLIRSIAARNRDTGHGARTLLWFLGFRVGMVKMEPYDKLKRFISKGVRRSVMVGVISYNFLKTFYGLQSSLSYFFTFYRF